MNYFDKFPVETDYIDQVFNNIRKEYKQEFSENYSKYKNLLDNSPVDFVDNDFF